MWWQLRNIEQEVSLRMEIREAAGAAHVYSDDLETLRDVSVPQHLGGVPATALAGAADPELLPKAAYDTGSMATPAELHSVPPMSTGGSGAEAVAQRVRARREELQARSRQRVNMYAVEPVVESAEEAFERGAAQEADGATLLATALGM